MFPIRRETTRCLQTNRTKSETFRQVCIERKAHLKMWPLTKLGWEAVFGCERGPRRVCDSATVVAYWGRLCDTTPRRVATSPSPSPSPSQRRTQHRSRTRSTIQPPRLRLRLPSLPIACSSSVTKRSRDGAPPSCCRRVLMRRPLAPWPSFPRRLHAKNRNSGRIRSWRAFSWSDPLRRDLDRIPSPLCFASRWLCVRANIFTCVNFHRVHTRLRCVYVCMFFYLAWHSCPLTPALTHFPKVPARGAARLIDLTINIVLSSVCVHCILFTRIFVCCAGRLTQYVFPKLADRSDAKSRFSFWKLKKRPRDGRVYRFCYVTRRFCFGFSTLHRDKKNSLSIGVICSPCIREN